MGVWGCACGECGHVGAVGLTCVVRVVCVWRAGDVRGLYECTVRVSVACVSYVATIAAAPALGTHADLVCGLAPGRW